MEGGGGGGYSGGGSWPTNEVQMVQVWRWWFLIIMVPIKIIIGGNNVAWICDHR